MIVSMQSAMVSRFGDRPSYLQEVFFWENSPRDHKNMIRSLPCRTPCRLYTPLAFAYILHMSLKCSGKEVNLDRAPPFPPMRVLEVKVMDTGSQSRV